ncbi:MAG: hypothetical protein ACLFPJ_05865 [Candidatus Woesearchaeota archaeon]
MVKLHQKFICVFFLFIVILLINACTLEMDKKPGEVEIIAPESISRVEPFEVTIKAKGVGANYLYVPAPCIFLEGELREGDEDKVPRIGTRAYTKYDGEEEITLKMAVSPFSIEQDDLNIRTCNIRFRNVIDSFTLSSTINEVEFDVKLNDFSVNHNLGQIHQELSNLDKLYIRNANENDKSFRISQSPYPYRVNNGKDPWFHSNPDYESLYLDEAPPTHKEYKQTSSDGLKIFYFIVSRESDIDDETTRINSEIFAIKFYPQFYVKFNIEKKQEVSKSSSASLKKAQENELLNNVETFKITSGGKSGKQSVGTYCGACGDDYICGACGLCIKKEDAINPKDVKIELDLKIEQPSEEILNAITELSVFRIYPNIKLFYKNKEINYCDLKEPGLNAMIFAEILEDEENIYSGFTNGFVTDVREKLNNWTLNLEEENERGIFIVSPNSKKKFFEDAKEIEQKIKFEIVIDEKLLENEEKTLSLLPPDEFKINLNANSNQVHQGSSGVLNIEIKGGTTPKVITKSTLLGPGKIRASGDDFKTDWILESMPKNSEISIAYHAPELGNFDIGSALSSLSMVELQKAAAKQIVSDAMSSYVGGQIDKAAKLAEAGKYNKRVKDFADIYSGYSDLTSIKDLPSGLSDVFEDGKTATGAKDGSVEAGWIERGAEFGIAGISALQTGVGIATLIPNKIPIVKKMTTKFDTAFSAATNIWKANFEYIAQSEKIERAEELFFPAPILVTAQDISGWTTQEMYVFQIAYHQLN